MAAFAILLSIIVAVSHNPDFNMHQDRKSSVQVESLADLPQQQYTQTTLDLRYTGKSAKNKLKMVDGATTSITRMIAELDRQGRVTRNVPSSAIPLSFDARRVWPKCSSIGQIRDQSGCGSCWAFAATSVIADRICIASGGRLQYSISVLDLMSCCGDACASGCIGGSPLHAMQYWVTNGLVTGSDYDAKQGCMPYPYPPCEHHSNNTRYIKCEDTPDFVIPVCTKRCQSRYRHTYLQDKHYGKSAYGLISRVRDIQAEIMLNGPVTASFDMYEDLQQYSGGIYVHRSGNYCGGHSAKVIGWGVDGGTPYWLAVNSWNDDWGENGLFRIIRGRNEVRFEEAIVAGLPEQRALRTTTILSKSIVFDK